jgi:hypothetical protein
MPPIKVFFKEDGPFALVDTAEDAAKLLKLGATTTVALPVVGKSTLTETESIGEFWAGINKNAKTFLTHLLKYKDGVRGDKFSEEINLSVEKFGGVLGGASKIAKKYGIKFGKIVDSEMRIEGTQRYRWLCPGSLLLKYGPELTVEIRLKVPSRISVGA